MTVLSEWREGIRRRRARREARALVREVRRGVARHAYRIPEDARAAMLGDADALESARQRRDHDRLEVLADRGFLKGSGHRSEAAARSAAARPKAVARSA